jgi:uncharacterized protein
LVQLEKPGSVTIAESLISDTEVWSEFMDAQRETLDAEGVAAFLRRKPDFLLAYPDLALSLRLPAEQRTNVSSLANYQLDVLREKNQQLTGRLHQLIQIAQDNELLMQRVHLLSLRLLKARNLAELVQQVAASLQEDFHTDLIQLILIDPPELDAHFTASASWLRAVPESMPELSLFAEVMKHSAPLCGRLKSEKLDFLFGARATDVASAVLMPMHPVALLAIGSNDANRFHPGMGTAFLEMMGEMIRTAIAVQTDRLHH